VNHAAPQEGTLLWTLADVRTTGLTFAVGLVLLGWSWFQAAGTATMSTQVGWLAVAVFATVVATAGACNWIWSGRRAVRVRRDDVIDALGAEFSGAAGSAAGIEVDSDPTSVPVGVEGTDRFHRDDCLLVRGKPVQRLASVTGRRACEMCRP
jgi:hypothetical protein